MNTYKDAKKSLSRLFPIYLLSMSMGFAHAQTVDDVANAGVKRANAGAAAQATIDKLSDETQDLVAKYKAELKSLEGLTLYNGLQQKQVDNQNTTLSDLTESIDKVAVIERQIVPLMVSMIDSLDQFIRLDVPFLLDERRDRINKLKTTLERPDVPVAEKFRQVLEAYEIEIEYGRTIEAHSGKLEQGDKVREVQFLRIGRIAYLYQTATADETGMWDTTNQQWQVVPAELYQRQVSRGLRLARKEEAPDLLIVPVIAPQQVVQ